MINYYCIVYDVVELTKTTGDLPARVKIHDCESSMLVI